MFFIKLMFLGMLIFAFVSPLIYLFGNLGIRRERIDLDTIIVSVGIRDRKDDDDLDVDHVIPYDKMGL